MARTDFDVIVVGGGAGGAASAYYLNRAGLRVLVVEKAVPPRYKACGGAIPRQTLARFPFSFDEVIRTAPDQVRFTFPGLPAVDELLPDRPVVMVMRSEFDAYLLACSGAEVLTGQAVTDVIESGDTVRVQLGGKYLTARYVVAADGAASTVARRLGLRRDRKLGGTLEAEVPLDGNRSLHREYVSRAVFSFGLIPWGYAWVFPKGESLSVGIGQFRQGRLDLRLELRREMERLGISLDHAKLYGHPLPRYEAPMWPFWQGLPQERLSTHRCLLVGDAAGLVDPFIGEGIRYAIASAQLASEAVASDDLSGYERAIWREIGQSLGTAGLTAGVYYHLPKLCFNVGVRNPATVHHLVDIVTERASYIGIGRRLLSAAAKWQLRGIKRAPVGRGNPADG